MPRARSDWHGCLLLTVVAAETSESGAAICTCLRCRSNLVLMGLAADIGQIAAFIRADQVADPRMIGGVLTQ